MRDSYRVLQRGFFQTLLASLRLHAGGLSAATGLAEAANSFYLTEGFHLGHRLSQGFLLWEGVFLAEREELRKSGARGLIPSVYKVILHEAVLHHLLLELRVHARLADVDPVPRRLGMRYFLRRQPDGVQVNLHAVLIVQWRGHAPLMYEVRVCNRGFVHVHHGVVLLGKHSVLGGLLAQLGNLPLQGPN